jgi:hypothetical protein
MDHMGPTTIILCEKLRETSALLLGAGDAHWAQWMDKSLARIEQGDLSGVGHLLSAYGGMGSFNDLILASANGHSVDDAEHRTVNERLDVLRTEMYELARKIQHEAET